MSKKTVLITGASRGIGKAILESFNNDYFIVGTGTSESSIKSILDNIKSLDFDGDAFKLDLGDRSSMKDLTTTLETKEIYPDILINNAGITRDNIMLRMQEDEWDNVIDVHLNGQYLLIKSFIKIEFILGITISPPDVFFKLKLNSFLKIMYAKAIKSFI